MPMIVVPNISFPLFWPHTSDYQISETMITCSQYIKINHHLYIPFVVFGDSFLIDSIILVCSKSSFPSASHSRRTLSYFRFTAAKGVARWTWKSSSQSHTYQQFGSRWNYRLGSLHGWCWVLLPCWSGTTEYRKSHRANSKHQRHIATFQKV